LKVFFKRLADTLKQSPVFFPFLSRESAVRSVEVRQKFLLRKFHSFFRPPQVFQRFWGWHVGLFGYYVYVTTELAPIVSLVRKTRVVEKNATPLARSEIPGTGCLRMLVME
jgi:hypothetical protein